MTKIDLTILVFSFVLTAFIIYLILITINNNKVISNESYTINAMNDINNNIMDLFEKDIARESKYYICCNSLQQYESYDFDKSLTEVVTDNRILFENMCIKIEYNKSLYQRYCDQIDNIEYSDEAACKKMGFSLKQVRSLETRYIKTHKYIPITSFGVVVYVYYTTPARRNKYSKTYKYNDEVIDAKINIIKLEKELRNESDYQRSIMSNSLRYDVMKRDNFKCVICGRSAKDGAILHVDHILPVSKGGKTEINNLRTLCSDCNLGKSDKYDYSGLN